MIRLYNYESAPQQRTFDTYNDVDCFHYSDLHDYIKFLKWGYGKVTDHACREIRLRRLSREQGIALVQRYQALPPSPKNVALFLEWLAMDAKEFWRYIDRKRDPSIWRKVDENNWQLLDSVENHIHDPGREEVRLEKEEERCDFELTASRDEQAQEDRYILIGRGYVDKR